MQFLTLFVLFAFAWAQADQSLTFAVASIKPTAASEQETKWGPEPGGRFSAKGATLKELIALAYGRTRVIPVYALTQSKSGPKLKAPAAQSNTMGFGAGFVSGTSVSMDLLARTLSMVLERPVVNQTGLNGEYEVHLEWSPDAPPGESADSSDLDARLASIFTAIQSELGLRLRPKRGPAEVFEVLEAKRPSEN